MKGTFAAVVPPANLYFPHILAPKTPSIPFCFVSCKLPEPSRSQLLKEFSRGFLKMTCISLHLSSARSVSSLGLCVCVCAFFVCPELQRANHEVGIPLERNASRKDTGALRGYHLHLSVLIDSTLRKWMLTEMASSAGRSSKTP